VTIFDQIRPNPSRKNTAFSRKKQEKWKISSILIDSKIGIRRRNFLQIVFGKCYLKGDENAWIEDLSVDNRYSVPAVGGRVVPALVGVRIYRRLLRD